MVENEINLLANELSATVSDRHTPEWKYKFEDLYSRVTPMFNKYYNQYINNNNLKKRNFDIDDYRSRYNMSIYEAVFGYDMNKGDFLSRVWYFAHRQFKATTSYNFATKRFNANLEYLDELHIDLTNCNISDKIGKTMFEVVEEFIEADTHGEIIKILLTTEVRAERSQLLSEYFGGSYGVSERKKVQRTRERLMKKIKEVFSCH